MQAAFTQLRHSTTLLVLTVLGMSLLFIVPVFMPLFGAAKVSLIGYAAWALMTGLYWPTVRLYGLSWVWAVTLPAAALFYIVATIDSARRYWQGKGGQWKGRTQAT